MKPIPEVPQTAEAVKNMREALRLSQRGLQEVLGLGDRAISLIENRRAEARVVVVKSLVLMLEREGIDPYAAAEGEVRPLYRGPGA